MSYLIEDNLHASFTPNSSPGRTLDTDFRPSASRPVLVIYTVRIAGTATGNLTGGRIDLLSDSATTPTTERCQARSSWKVTGALTTFAQAADSILTYLVPAGDYVRMVTTTENGAPTFTLIDQTEIPL